MFSDYLERWELTLDGEPIIALAPAEFCLIQVTNAKPDQRRIRPASGNQYQTEVRVHLHDSIGEVLRGIRKISGQTSGHT
jgi:hypothetical protein